MASVYVINDFELMSSIEYGCKEARKELCQHPGTGSMVVEKFERIMAVTRAQHNPDSVVR